MTLVEFIAPLAAAGHRERVLATMYFLHNHEGAAGLTVEAIRAGLQRARASNWRGVNIPRTLAESGALVEGQRGENGSQVWRLTGTGSATVRDLLKIQSTSPQAVHDVAALKTVVSKLTDPDVRAYVEEAIKCLEVGALRACVVFLWVGAISTLHDRMLLEKTSDVNLALQKHYAKAKHVTRAEDFAYIKDSVAILAAQDLKILDKGEKDTLEEALSLRNRCGHPGKYIPGEKKVSSYIEDLSTILFR